MSLRKNRKRRSLVQRALGLWAAWRVARRAWVVGGLAVAALAALLGRRRARRAETELEYGPPNESVPSHETLAPAQAAAQQSS